jgi:glycosyltransferase involved in cell wall biosynthesis
MALPNVTFVGLVSLDQAAEHIAATDAILIPLKRTDQIEITIPGKIFDAAAAGKPMLVSAVGASATLVDRYEAGLVVPPEEPAALADAIIRLRSDPALQARLCEGALKMAQDFDREQFASQMLEQIRMTRDRQQNS